MVPCSDEAAMSGAALVVLVMAVARLKSARALKMALVLTEISNNIQGEILNFQMIKLHLRRSQPMLVKDWPKPANSFTMMQSL